MTVAYGDDESVAAMLEPQTPGGYSAETLARIPVMREVISRLIDEQTGRTFGTVGASGQRIVPIRTNSSVLVLPTPARTITEIRYGFDDEAGVISGGTALTSDAWTVAYRDGEGNVLALRSLGWWYGYGGAVAITGTWADEDTTETVPDAINWATNYLSAKRLAEEMASPAGAVGPDGSVVPIRNPWNTDDVKQIISQYRLVTAGLIV